MECRLVELKKERSTREHSEASQKTLEKVVKLIDVVQLLIELDTQCFILYSVEHLVMTVSSSLSTLPSI